MKGFLEVPLVGLLILFGMMAPAIASGRSGRLNPCNTRIFVEDSTGGATVAHGRTGRTVISHGRTGRTSRTVVSGGRTVVSNSSSNHIPRITRIERTCLVHTRRIRAETAACGLNQYSQPRVGEFRRSEWRRNNRVIYAETELVRCF